MKTIRLMAEYFQSSPEDIKIALGPSIRGDCYRVDSDVKSAVCAATGEGKYCREISGEKYCVDLASANLYQALSQGVPGGNTIRTGTGKIITAGRVDLSASCDPGFIWYI